MREIEIHMLTTIRGIAFISKPGTILYKDIKYKAEANKNGAVSGVCDNGEKLGVKPGEFEFVKAPQWLLEIHNRLK